MIDQIFFHTRIEKAPSNPSGMTHRALIDVDDSYTHEIYAEAYFLGEHDAKTWVRQECQRISEAIFHEQQRWVKFQLGSHLVSPQGLTSRPTFNSWSDNKNSDE